MRYLTPRIPGVGFGGAVPAIAARRKALDRWLALTEACVARFDDGVRHQAPGLVGLRLAVIGKGWRGQDPPGEQPRPAIRAISEVADRLLALPRA